MDLNLKQWREHQLQHASDQEQAPAKLPRRHPHPQPQHPPSASSALPLFVTEPTSKLTSSNLSAYTPDHSAATATNFSRMGSYFSLAQWQELELQALIYRLMLAGAAIPSELLHLVKKSLINSSHPYFLPHHFQHYQHLQPAALPQSEYWGRGAMDPEPGRCRRTDGKKWRCSRDVIVGQKYCERHMHRGRNRSRKPVEIPTIATVNGGGNAGVGMLKVSNSISTQPSTATVSGENRYMYSGPSLCIGPLHLSQRSSESMVETQNHGFGTEKSGGGILRHFFDDWPRSLQDPDNGESSVNSMTLTNNLSISDFSLKLSTGDGNEPRPQVGNVGRERGPSNWSASWGTNQVPQMGGPLAEALRSATSNSSPTSVLHQLPKASATSQASYIGT